MLSRKEAIMINKECCASCFYGNECGDKLDVNPKYYRNCRFHSCDSVVLNSHTCEHYYEDHYDKKIEGFRKQGLM